jgi:tRNA (guanine37-N1)-methyltransferase
MKAPGLQVPRSEGERWRRRLQEDGLLRTDLEIQAAGSSIFLPLREPLASAPGGFPVEVREFSERPRSGPESYRELVELPPEERALLPRSFDIVGDIVLVRIPPELSGAADAIGAALLRFVPGARVVGQDLGVHGSARVRELRRLAGTGGFRTVHRENGLRFTVDLDRAYFSPRLAREHARVAALVGPRRRVLDLCCGIGPFARTIAARQPTAEITAVDLNPAAIELLDAELGPPRPGRIHAVCQDAGEFLAHAPAFDHVVLNLPHEGRPLLPALHGHLRPGAIVHYYEVVERSEAAACAREIVAAVAGTGPGRLLDEHVVHEYSPTSDLRGYSVMCPEGSEP